METFCVKRNVVPFSAGFSPARVALIKAVNPAGTVIEAL